MNCILYDYYAKIMRCVNVVFTKLEIVTLK